MTLPFLKKLSGPKISVGGVPSSVPSNASALFRSRVDMAARDLLEKQGLRELDVRIQCSPVADDGEEAAPAREPVPASRTPPAAPKYACREPLFGPDFLVVSAPVRQELDDAIELLKLEPLLFGSWGLNEIEPCPRSALNFHGPPGTGKTLAAHAVASAMERRILSASYADIESMYHGEGPKNVVELFRTAEAANAVLFLDEADSLLSKRLNNVTQGSEQAINSMRSQLLISLDGFKGLVIFATNLVANYDPAFDTRVRHVHFPAPDKEARMELWRRHIPARLPVGETSFEALADSSDGLVGRDIKNAVIAAAVSAARANSRAITQEHLLSAVATLRQSRLEKETVQVGL